MMGRQTGDQSQLFYLFNLEELIPASHLLRRINPVVSRVLAELRENLTPFYSDIGRPSIDPQLMLRMLIVGYCYGMRTRWHAYTTPAIPHPERCAANAPAPIRRSNHLAHRPHQSVMRSSALATLSILAASAAP